jgi:hypothetical protein
MKLFTKQQIEGALKARHLYKTLAYPSNADFEAVLQVGGIGGCTVTVDDAKVVCVCVNSTSGGGRTLATPA